MSELGVVAAIHRDTNSLTAVIPAWGLRPIEGVTYGGEPPPPLSWGWFDDEGAGGSWVYNRPRGPTRQLLHDDFTIVGAGPTLLDAATLRGGTDTGVTISSGTHVDVDATNLAVTFVAPPSGQVVVKFYGWWQASSLTSGVGHQMFFSVREGTTPLTIEDRVMTSPGAGSTAQVGAVPSLTVTGLTPGQTYTWKWAARIAGQNGSLLHGPSNGELRMEVHTAGMISSDTPWRKHWSGGTIAQLPGEGGGVARLTTATANDTVAIDKDADCLVVSDDLALWYSARVRPVDADGVAVYAGFADDTASTRLAAAWLDNPFFGHRRWAIVGNGASQEGPLGSEAADLTWQTIDVVLVGGAFIGVWVDGDPAFTSNTPLIPAVGDGLQPILLLSSAGSEAVQSIDVDWIQTSSFADFAGPTDLAPSMEGIVEDPIAQA